MAIKLNGGDAPADEPMLLTPCIEWRGSRQLNGYGKLGRNGVTLLAHRVAFEDQAGPIPPGLELDHLCANPSCINVRHLEPVTGVENRRRARARRLLTKLMCRHGHPWSEATTYYYNGYRYCRTCNTESHRRAF